MSFNKTHRALTAVIMQKERFKRGVAGALTGNSQVRVGLDFSCSISGKALEHAGVVGQEAVDLQAASHQHPVPGVLHRADGHGVLVPHDVRLGHSCRGRERAEAFTVSRPCLTFSLHSSGFQTTFILLFLFITKFTKTEIILGFFFKFELLIQW